MRTTVVLVVHDRLALTHACLASLRATTASFVLCVVDNASSDGTEAAVREIAAEASWPLDYLRYADNAGLIRALNQGARRVATEFACFLHSDTRCSEPGGWPGSRPQRRQHIGLAGLYGARQALRRDGRFVGRSIVHGLAGQARMPAPVVEVAAVDGVCLFVGRALLDEVSGFDEGYGSSTATTATCPSGCARPGVAPPSSTRPSSTGAAAPAPGPRRRGAPRTTSPTGAPRSPASPRSGRSTCPATCARSASGWPVASPRCGRHGESGALFRDPPPLPREVTAT